MRVMRNSSLAHLLNPEALYSTLFKSLFTQSLRIYQLNFSAPVESNGFAPVNSSTLGSIPSFTNTRKKLKLRRRAPLLLAFLAIFCFGMGLGIQQIFPNSELFQDNEVVIDSNNSRMGACTVTKDNIKLDLTLSSSPRIKIFIKHFGGEIVYRRDVNLGRQKKLNMDIDLSVFPEGIYMLKVESGDQQLVRLITHS